MRKTIESDECLEIPGQLILFFIEKIFWTALSTISTKTARSFGEVHLGASILILNENIIFTTGDANAATITLLSEKMCI